MSLKPIWPMLAATALIAMAPSAMAEGSPQTKGANVNTAATGTKGGVASLAMAQELYLLGMANKDALMVLTAAKLAASVEVKAVTHTKETKGDALPDQAKGADAPTDAATMMTAAKMLAGEDEVIAGLIEDVAVEGSRGRVAGASSTLSQLSAGQSDVWEIPFYGDSYAEVAVLGDGDANLDLLVTDENGHTICFDVSWSDKIYCDFSPSWNGYFYVTVQNNGAMRNSYHLITN